MTGVALGIDIDLSTDVLEDRLTDNCKCESTHQSRWDKGCSIEVVASIRTCTANGLYCQSHVDAVASFLTQTRASCPRCGKADFGCLVVTPV